FLEMNPRQCEPFIDLLVHWIIVAAETAAGSSQLRRTWDTLADRVADCDLPKTVAAQLLAWMLTRSRGIAKERERKGVSDLIRLAAHHIDEESFSSSAGAGLCRVIIAKFNPTTQAACSTLARAIADRGGQCWWKSMQDALREAHVDSSVAKALLLPATFTTEVRQRQQEEKKNQISPSSEALPTSLEDSLASLKTLDSVLSSDGQIEDPRRLLKLLTRASTFVFDACEPSTDSRVYLAFLDPVERVTRSPEFWRRGGIPKQDLAEFITYMLSPLVNRSLRHVLTHCLEPPCEEVFEKLNHIVIHSMAYYPSRTEAFEVLLEVGLRDQKFVSPVVRCIDKLTRKGMIPSQNPRYSGEVALALLQHTRDLLRLAEHAGASEVAAGDLAMACKLARGHCLDLKHVVELLPEETKTNVTPRELALLRAVCGCQIHAG
ncbi:hypothetical protein FOZ63_029012, partial [Perkinsus olseni]